MPTIALSAPTNWFERNPSARRKIHHFPCDIGRFTREQHAADDVGDVREVARLLAVAEDHRSKASTLLGYRQIVPFEDGLRATVEWCRSSSSMTVAEIPEKPAA